jgi:LCP family protein required for cell wall assembly
MMKKEKKIFAPSSKQTGWNIALVALTILMDVLVAYLLIYVSSYSALSKKLFVLANVVILLILLAIDFSVYCCIRSMKKKAYVIAAVLLSVFIVIGGYGTYAAIRVQGNIDSMSSAFQTANVSAAFVTYKQNQAVISDESSLSGKKIAIAKDTQTANIAKERLANENVSVQYVECNGYTETYKALVTGQADCAVLTSTWQSMFEEDTTLSKYINDCSTLATFSGSVTNTNNAGAQKDLTKEPFTILLTGENEGLADTIMVLSVNPVSMKVTMTSVARDSYVPISCYGSSSKINAAHAVSEDCMVQTVENLLGITIDYTVEFNFASVIQVVDAVGGVDVDITESFDAQCWDIATDSLEVYHLDAGDNQHLNGTLALGFARERYAFSDGDFARQRHQQQIIEQVLGKIMASKDPNMLLNVMDAAGSNITMNFTRDQLVNFISYAMKKADRYYGDNLTDVFDIVHSRVYGYDSSVYDPGYNMDLYIYKLYNGSVQATHNAIERNINLDSAITTSVPVSWSASTEYTAPLISEEYYAQ